MSMSRIGGGAVAVAAAVFLVVLMFSSSSVKAEETEEIGEDYVVALDHTNFTDFVYKQDFIVVEFYAPWCGACRGFEPEYKKAAKELQKHDPPIILAKIDASAEENSAIREEYKVEGYPTVKTFRNQGKNIEEYFGKRQAEELVIYFTKLHGPPSVEIKSAEDGSKLIDDQHIFIVGLFPEFKGEEFTNFTKLAEKLRTRFDFRHTSNANFLPRRERFNKPTLRLFKPFDQLFVDFKDFNMNAMRKFIQESDTPILTIYDDEEINERYVDKFFNYKKSKAMLFINFTTEYDTFKPKYYELAKVYNKKGISFLLGDLEAGENLFKYFALKQEQAPLILIYSEEGTKYLKTNVAPNDIAPWLKDYKDGKLEEYIRSEPIPEVNDEPVKVVVLESLQKMVFESGKDVVLELYESVGCGLCKRLAPILDEVAISFENDTDILIAKLDTNANDITTGIFDVQEFPTLYLRSASGKIVLYQGSKMFKKEDIVEFIQKNRDTPAKPDSPLIVNSQINPHVHTDEL